MLEYCQQSITITHIILIYLNLNGIFVCLHEFVYTNLHCLALYMRMHTFCVGDLHGEFDLISNTCPGLLYVCITIKAKVEYGKRH